MVRPSNYERLQSGIYEPISTSFDRSLIYRSHKIPLTVWYRRSALCRFCRSSAWPYTSKYGLQLRIINYTFRDRSLRTVSTENKYLALLGYKVMALILIEFMVSDWGEMLYVPQILCCRISLGICSEGHDIQEIFRCHSKEQRISNLSYQLRDSSTIVQVFFFSILYSGPLTP